MQAEMSTEQAPVRNLRAESQAPSPAIPAGEGRGEGSELQSFNLPRRCAEKRRPHPNPLPQVMRARGVGLFLCLCSLLAIFSGCGDNDPATLSTPGAGADGFVDASAMRERQLDYLRFATTQLIPGSPLNLIAHMERTRVDPTYSVAPAAAGANAWDGIFAKMARLEDTRDFDALYVTNALLGYRDHPLLDRELVRKTEEAMLAFKYWYTEPSAPGLVDDSYYWTENHELIYHTLEYLMGQTYPDRVFTNDGKSGREHMQHAHDLIMRWFDLRARFGFFEWHSNVYYQKDATPLLTLAEFANDEEIRTRAAGILDVLLFDIGIHTFRGAFGVTHGRSYKKDKMSSLDDDTRGMVKLLFATSEFPYASLDDAAVLFARMQKYRLPEVVYRAGTTHEPVDDRERMGIGFDEFAPYEPNPQAPYEFSFTDPKDLTLWWSMSALTAWQLLPLTVGAMNQYDLWTSTNFTDFAELKPLASDLEFAQKLAQRTAHYFSFSLLKEVNTHTYRSADYMLSSAQDYRPGSFQWQAHSWQATLDPNAVVFTTHPTRPLVRTTNWREDTETGSYWTGEASMPRSAQQENVAIHIYAPQYAKQNPSPFTFFRYEPYTHAYFPQDHFDEVVQEGPWTIGKFRDGYVALYSYRPASWVVYDPNVYATNGMIKPFDLKAEGGADNVWIVECGNKEKFGSFDQFRAAIAAAAVTITPRPRQGSLSAGYDVVYDSPSQGRVSFGWQAPLTVKGVEVPITGYPRYDNPWSQTPFNSRALRLEKDGVGVDVDITAGTRRVFATQ